MKALIKTTQKTFNKTLKKMIVEELPEAKSFRKLHVAGMGYVFYIKNSNGENIGHVYKDRMSNPNGLNLMIK